MELNGRLAVKHRRALVPTWLAKSLMAVTGIVMAAFVLVHMIGNLKILIDPSGMDHYAAWLREILYPVLPHEGVLWIFRIVMAAALGVHLICAWLLWRRGAATKTRGKTLTSFRAWSTKLMLPTGVILLAFVALHLMDLTLGVVVAPDGFLHPDPEFHAAANVVASLSRPLMAGMYVFALLALSLHLAHGLPQAWMDLGGAGRTGRTWAHAIGGTVAALILLGDGAVILYALVTGGAL